MTPISRRLDDRSRPRRTHLEGIEKPRERLRGGDAVVDRLLLGRGPGVVLRRAGGDQHPVVGRDELHHGLGLGD